MNHQSEARRFLFCLLQACGIGLLAGAWASAAIAAGPLPLRTFGPAAAGARSATMARPPAGLPRLIVDNGVYIGGTYLPVVTSSIPTIRSSVMIQSPNGMNGLGCRFPISFGIRNIGSGPTPSSFDVSVAIGRRGLGGQGTVNSVVYSMNPLKAGSVETGKGSFDVLQGSYTVWLEIDKYHRVKQAGWLGGYGFVFNAVCGNGIYRPPGGRAMHMPAPK